MLIPPVPDDEVDDDKRKKGVRFPLNFKTLSDVLCTGTDSPRRHSSSMT